MAFLTELIEHRAQLKVILLAGIEQPDCSLALLLVQLHAAHDGFGCRDFLGCYLAVSLGDMAHHGKGRREECGLDALLLASLVCPRAGGGLEAVVKIASQRRTEQCAQRPAEHEAECPSQ